jgi:CBS domain-containing protein
MQVAADLMTRTLITLLEDDLLDDADRYVELANIRHLPVVRGRKLVGLITHRDLLRECRRKDPKTGRAVTAAQVMTRDVKAVRPGTPLREVVRTMLSNKFGCLPVTSGSGELVGIITEHDLLRLAEERIAEVDLQTDAKLYDP